MNYIDALAQNTRAAIRTILGEAEGFVWPANQTRPIGKVDAPFCTVLLYNHATVGTPVVRGGTPNADPAATDMDYLLDAYCEFSASVQFFKNRARVHVSDAGALVDAAGIPQQSQWAFSRADSLVKSMWHPLAKLALRPYGLGYLGTAGPVRDLTAQNDSLWESRAQVTLNFGIVNRQTSRMALLGALNFEMRFAPPGGPVVTTTLSP